MYRVKHQTHWQVYTCIYTCTGRKTWIMNCFFSMWKYMYIQSHMGHYMYMYMYITYTHTHAQTASGRPGSCCYYTAVVWWWLALAVAVASTVLGQVTRKRSDRLSQHKHTHTHTHAHTQGTRKQVSYCNTDPFNAHPSHHQRSTYCIVIIIIMYTYYYHYIIIGHSLFLFRAPTIEMR